MSTAESAAAPALAGRRPGSGSTNRHLRGSSLLSVGRLISVGVTFATQVLIIRYLSKADFGVFAYALSIVTIGQTFALLGLDKTLARFLPIYEEGGEWDKLWGALLMVAGVVLLLGFAVVAFVFGLRGMFDRSVIGGGDGMTVMLILVLLAPVQALDEVLMGAFAVFSKPRAIFFRKHVLGPALRLAAVVSVLLAQGHLPALSIGYVAASAIGVTVYTGMLVRTLRADGVLAHLHVRTLQPPVREIFGFALPLLTTDLLFVVLTSVSTLMLGHYGSAHDVADYRAAFQVARMNMLVMTSFMLLFTPVAARLYARGDREGIQDLYWRTATWIAVISFPIFAACVSLPHLLAVTLFGGRYGDSSAILAVLAIGYYFNAALGFNGLTLRVFGLVRYLVVISVVAVVFSLAINVLLIPAYGALGAGIATCATVVFHNVLKQVGLRRGTGISVMHRAHLHVYGVIIVATGALVGAAALRHPGVLVGAILVAITSAAVLWCARSSMRLGETFPALRRVPGLGRLVL
jgi:O-antigen/teichoic acid export membrane protein